MQFVLNNLVMLLLFSGVVINYYYYYVQVSQFVRVFAAPDREIPQAKYCQSSKLGRLKQSVA